MGSAMAAAASLVCTSLASAFFSFSPTRLSTPALVRFPLPKLFCKVVGDNKEQGRRLVRDRGLLAHSVAPKIMDGVYVNGEMEEKREKRDGCVKAVLFDMDDTLVLTHAIDKAAQEAARVLAERHVPHIDGEEMVKVFTEKFDVSPWDQTHQVDVSEWRARIWNEALQSQGVDDMALARVLQNTWETERMSSFQWAPGVEAMVQRLHKSGIKVGIITNGHFLVQRNKLKACKADLLFDTILVGGEEPNQKPHKSIFLKACSLAGCNPEEAIMVGDNLKTDIQGAQNAGFLTTVWVNLHNLEDLPAGGATPDHIISNILELPGLLKTLEVNLGQ